MLIEDLLSLSQNFTSEILSKTALKSIKTGYRFKSDIVCQMLKHYAMVYSGMFQLKLCLLYVDYSLFYYTGLVPGI